MSWSRDDFLAVMKTDVAIALLKDPEIAGYIASWPETENKIDHIAALLHANHVTADSNVEQTKPLLQLVAAFANKDYDRLKELVDQGVSVGARLDYMLPLFDERLNGGEDAFVASVKAMFSGTAHKDVTLAVGNMKHMVGNQAGQNYGEEELRFLEKYVNNSFKIRKLLQSARNKTVIEPNENALQYLLEHADTYRDSNDNPVIVFIPGVVSVDRYPVSAMIDMAVKHGGKINDVGFFGVPGIVWSIILGDVSAVSKFLDLGARVDLEDEMGNKNVMAWAATTSAVMQTHGIDKDYKDRLLQIMMMVSKVLPSGEKNNLGKSPSDYLEGVTKKVQFKSSPYTFFVYGDGGCERDRNPVHEKRVRATSKR